MTVFRLALNNYIIVQVNIQTLLKKNKYAIYVYTHGPVTGSGPSVVWP